MLGNILLGEALPGNIYGSAKRIYEIDASGLITFAAGASYNDSFYRDGSGVFILSSSGIVSLRYDYAPLGILSLSGDGSYLTTNIIIPAGGITFSRESGLNIIFNGGSVPVYTLSGTADNSKLYSFIPSGSISYSGSSDKSLRISPAVSGNINFSSASSVSSKFDIISSGGLIFGGNAQIVIDVFGGYIYLSGSSSISKAYQMPSGGKLSSLGGSAFMDLYSYMPQLQNLNFGGSAQTIFSPSFANTYSIIFSSSASTLQKLNFEGQGSANLSGNADKSVIRLFSGDGTFGTFGGSGFGNIYAFVANGTLTVVPQAVKTYSINYSSIGSFSLSDAGINQYTYSYTSSGSLSLQESGIVNKVFKYTPLGALTLSATAIQPITKLTLNVDGAISFSNAASYSVKLNILSDAAVLSFGGEAQKAVYTEYYANGDIFLDGGNSYKFIAITPASGTMALDNKTAYSFGFINENTSTINLVGQSVYAISKVLSGNGGIVTSGEADKKVIKIHDADGSLSFSVSGSYVNSFMYMGNGQFTYTTPNVPFIMKINYIPDIGITFTPDAKLSFRLIYIPDIEISLNMAITAFDFKTFDIYANIKDLLSNMQTDNFLEIQNKD